MMSNVNAESQPAIRCIDLGYQIDRFVILEAIDLNIRRGELHTLLGPSGSGKSTILRLLSGLASPTHGSIELMGHDATRQPPHLRKIAYVNQTATTYDHLSVADNLRIAQSLAPPASRTLRDATEHPLVEAFELRETFQQRASELSGGQRQRLAILRALLTERPILLLDEPLSHLQESLKSPLRALLKHWLREKLITCVLVTHDSHEAYEVSDRISILDHGKILQSGSPQELYEHPQDQAVAERFDRPSIQWFSLPPTLGMRPRLWIPGWSLTSPLPTPDGSAILCWDSKNSLVQARGILQSKRNIESSVFLEFLAGPHRVNVVRPLTESDQYLLGEEVAFHYSNPISLTSPPSGSTSR